MVDGDQPGPFRVTKGREVTVPGEEPRIDLAQEIGHLCARLLVLALGRLPYAQDGDGVHRRLAQATSVRWREWCVRGSRGAGPVVRTGIITVRRSLRVEDDVRYLAGLPLVGEEGAQLLRRPAGVEVGEADGYERRIPAPLVWVQPWSSAGPSPHVVSAQDSTRLCDQLFGLFGNLSPRMLSHRAFNLCDHSYLLQRGRRWRFIDVLPACLLAFAGRCRGREAL